MPIQASIRLLALMLKRPNHILANPLVPVMFCDYDYEETNSLAALCTMHCAPLLPLNKRGSLQNTTTSS